MRWSELSMSAESFCADSCRVPTSLPAWARMWLRTWDPRTCACIAVAAFTSCASQPNRVLLVLIGDASRVSGTRCVAVQAYRGFWMELAGDRQNAKRKLAFGGIHLGTYAENMEIQIKT